MKDSINSKSKKQSKIDGELKTLFNKILVEHDGKCTGCGSNKNLTLSHIIRRSLEPSLITNPLNIKPHCIHCHEKWDSGDLMQMLELEDFFDNFNAVIEMSTKHSAVFRQKLADLIQAGGDNEKFYQQKLVEASKRHMKRKFGIGL